MQYSLYFHIPFCRHRCAYCDFNTYAGQEDSLPAYVEALRREVELVGRSAAERLQVHTIFFGGGTPSLLSAEQFDGVLREVHRSFRVLEDAEITMEANPGTVNGVALRQLRKLGINRISFGAQSANGEELRMLERQHSFLDVIEAVRAARRAGFDNINLDLIYGLPEQSLETWKTTVRRVLDLHPDHVSAYALTLEHGTPFGRWTGRGLMAMPDPDAAAEMYEWLGQELEASGFGQYEISNWGRKLRAISPQHSAKTREPDHACKHNLQYWRGLPYLGLGAGAHGYANGYRYSNVLRIKTYIGRIMEQGEWNAEEGKAGEDRKPRGRDEAGRFPRSPAAVNSHQQSDQDDMSEFMITGLRLTQEGIQPAEFLHRFGRELKDVYGTEIQELIDVGLLESVQKETSEAGSTSEAVRLTERGRLLGNQVFMRFV